VDIGGPFPAKKDKPSSLLKFHGLASILSVAQAAEPDHFVEKLVSEWSPTVTKWMTKIDQEGVYRSSTR
jgi:hypothetical protein